MARTGRDNRALPSEQSQASTEYSAAGEVVGSSSAAAAPVRATGSSRTVRPSARYGGASGAPGQPSSRGLRSGRGGSRSAGHLAGRPTGLGQISEEEELFERSLDELGQPHPHAGLHIREGSLENAAGHLHPQGAEDSVAHQRVHASYPLSQTHPYQGNSQSRSSAERTRADPSALGGDAWQSASSPALMGMEADANAFSASIAEIDGRSREILDGLGDIHDPAGTGVAEPGTSMRSWTVS